MQPLKVIPGLILCDANGMPVGVMGANGKEYLLATSQNNLAATQPITYYQNAVIRASDYQANRTDLSGTPGNGNALSSPRGRAAFAAATNSVVITSTLVTATSSIFLQLNTADATLSQIDVIATAGSFTVTGNANATGITTFDFFIIN